MTFAPPTALDFATAAMLAIAYLGAAGYGLAISPRDIRARTFAALAAANAVFALLPLRGFDRRTIVAGISVAAVGSTALFHFAMVFPWRQRWFRPRRGWMPALYVVPPMAIAALNWYAPRAAEDLTMTRLLVLAAAGLPLLVVLALVLPLAALIALYGNIRRARRDRIRAAYAPTVGIFVSELGGGLLAAVLGTLLQTMGLNRATAAAIAISALILNVIAPLAFALGVGRYRVLSLDPDAI